MTSYAYSFFTQLSLGISSLTQLLWVRVKIPFELRRGLLLRATVMSKLRNFARFAECVISVFSADRLKLSLSDRNFAMLSFIRKASFLLPIIPTRKSSAYLT